MKKSQKRILVVLCVAIGIVVILSVALRVMLTKEVLMDLVVPRLEQAVRAEITAQDIGVRFPFGFGVDIKGLSFEKTLTQGERVSFESETIVARASLLSLVKRRPVIKRVDIENGRISAAGGTQGIDARVEGLRAVLSMRPVPEGYRAAMDLDASSVKLSLREQPSLDLGAIRFEGEVLLDAAFDSLRIERAEIGWKDLATLEIAGDVKDLKKSRNVSLRFSSEGIELPRFIEQVLALGPVSDTPKREGQPILPANVRAGTVDIESTLSGSLAQPSGMSISGVVGLEGLELDHPAFAGSIALQGQIRFSESNLQSDGMSIAFGSSKARVGFDIDIVERKRIGEIRTSVDADLVMEDLVPPEQRDAAGAKGSLGLKLDMRGTQADLAALLPGGSGKATPERIGMAWKRVQLQGKLSFDDVRFTPEGNPFRLSGLTGSALIDGGDMKNVEAAFQLNGSPYRCRATLSNIMPASMELLAKSKEMDGSPIEDLAPLLRSIENTPRFDVELEGRSLDLRPFEKKKVEEGGKSSAGKKTGNAPQTVPAANPLVFLTLVNTIFEARLDSVIASKALFTGVNAKGAIREGLLAVDPVTLQYAGGIGRARFEADLRKPSRIESKLDISFEEVQADRALGGLHPLGKFLSGSFSFSSDASFASGPGLDPLASMSGKGFALSNSGSVDISRFIAPLAQLGLIDLSHLGQFDFSEWRGNFLVREGRFFTENWAIKSNKGDWKIKGSFGLDGTLDYTVRLVVPPLVQGQMKDLSKYGDLVNLFRDTRGNLVLDLDLGGTSKDPKVSINMSGAKEKAKDSLLKKAQDLFKK